MVKMPSFASANNYALSLTRALSTSIRNVILWHIRYVNALRVTEKALSNDGLLYQNDNLRLNMYMTAQVHASVHVATLSEASRNSC